MTKKPAEWKSFLMNSDNKTQLVDTINTVWSLDSFASKLLDRKVVMVAEGHCYLLESTNGEVVTNTEIDSLFSDQEETDSRIILYCLYAQDQGYATARIRSPDSDVFFIALHYALHMRITILFDTGSGNRRRLINHHWPENWVSRCAQLFLHFTLSHTVTLPVHLKELAKFA